MKKKILSLLLAVTLAFSCLAMCFSAYASMTTLILDSKMCGTISDYDDLVWFTYTPDASGTYSFLSYNVRRSEAYLFIREKDPDTGAKVFTQLAYDESDLENYEANGHNQFQFCLTYHLEAGTQYYYAAGWYLSDSRDDGTTSTVSGGADEIDGYNIRYVHSQSTEHWYLEDDENYTGNVLTVKVLDKTADINVKIIEADTHLVSGSVTDMLGSLLKNAKLKIDSTTVATTDENGEYSFYYTSGQYAITVSADNAIARTVNASVSASGESNYTSTPIELCTCDYYSDSVINIKDFATIRQTLEGNELEAQLEQYEQTINFTSDDYPSLTITSAS
ncbi:MAG: carboxypeptidase-like regulatory domain-containing protein [Clostridiales bacterium]|nr:carboxypeptidase-like regulatory domain-containing protein [Clostridiales bacterium]